MTMHLRSRQYLLLVGFAGVLGVLAASLTLLFLWTEHGLQALLWHDFPDALGVDPHPWFTIAVTTLGGIAVGIVVRFVPGHGGPGPVEGHGVGETHIPLTVLPGILAAALVSLATPSARPATAGSRQRNRSSAHSDRLHASGPTARPPRRTAPRI